MGRYWRFLGLVILVLILALPTSARAASPVKWAVDPLPWPVDLAEAVKYTANKQGWFLDRESYYAIGDISQDRNNPYIWYATLLQISPDADPQNWNFLADVMGNYAMSIRQSERGLMATFDDAPSTNELRENIDRAVETITANIELPWYETPILPWLKNTYATYGVLGLHLYDAYGDNSYPGWYAVDFVGGPYLGDTGMPNGVYASTTGVVTVLCRDGTQMGIKIDDYQYLHLVDIPGLYTGKNVERGTYLGQLVTGDNDTTCGYTDQSAENYHLHFGFIPSEEMMFENYLFAYGVWRDQRTGDIGETGDTLYAEWISEINPSELPPGLPPDYNLGRYEGVTFWDGILDGVRLSAKMLGARFFPAHVLQLPTTQIVSIAAISIALIFMVAMVNFAFPLAVFSVISLLESTRLVMAIWRQIKNMFPGA